MANINIKKGSYANKANLKNDGDIGFAKYNSNTGTFIVNDGGTLVNLMPAPGELADAGKPLVSQGQDKNGNSLSPIYSTLGVKGGGTGRATLDSGKVLIGNGTGAVSLRSITNNTSLSSIKYISATSNLITANTLAYWNGAFSDTGNSRITKVGTIDKGTWKATPIAIEYGGTGATTAAAARTNLGITPANIGADPKGSINRTFSTAPIYSYSSGVLIDFNMNEKSGFMIVVKIYGHSYDKDKSPIEAIYQFFDLSDGAINNTYCGTAISGPSIPLRVYRISGKLKAWFKQPTSYCTFRVEVFYGNNSGGNIPNITLSNAVAPTQEISQTITITPKKVYAGASDMADNMLLTKSGLDMIATNNYVADRKLAIGSSSAPNENLYVNGTSKITGASTLAGITKITNATDSTVTTDGALVVTGGVGIGKSLRVAGSAAVAGVVVAGTNGTAATTNKLSVYGQSQFNGNAAITGTLNVADNTTLYGKLVVDNDSTTTTNNVVIKGQIRQDSSMTTGSYNAGTITFPTYYKKGANDNLIFDLGGVANRQIVITITGNSYAGNKAPIHSVYQFYHMNNTVTITANARSYGCPLGDLKIYQENSRIKACLLKNLRSFQTLNISIQYSHSTPDEVSFSVVNSANDPTATKTILATLTPRNYANVEEGGTGITVNPSMLVNLGSTTADNVFKASPKPGVTGTLGIANGGTGATTAAAARTNLGAAYCQTKTSTLPGTIGWYRIAQGDGLSNGTFEIKASVSNHYSVTTLIAGSGYTENSSIQQLAHNAYPGGTGISKARIVYGGGKTHLEVYQPHAVQKTITVKMTEGFGWTNIDPELISSIPSSYSSNEIILASGKMISPTYESYLTWGGKNFASSFGPIDAALAPELGSNRLAYGHPNGITVEYSRNGGATWIDYEMHPANKVRLVTPGLGSVVMVAGKGDSAANGNIAGNQNYQSRVVLSSASLPLYTALNKFIILVGTNGFANCWCTIEKKVGTTWTIVADKVGISGWTGYNVINIPNTVFGTGSGQASEIRLTFGGTGQTANSKYTGLGIYSIAAFGGMGWTTPSTLAKVGRIYSLDATTTLDSNGRPIPIVTFPSQVKISDTTAPVNTATGALVVSGGAGIGGDIRVAGNAVVTGKIVAGANGTAATTNKLTIYGQSQFNGNAAITGTLNVNGATTVKTLTISDTTDIGHLSFSRSDGPNYIKAPYKIAFNVGSTLSLKTCALTIGSNYVVPGVADYSSLGTADIFWKEVYATTLNGTNGLISNIQGNNALFSTKVGCQFDPSENANSIYLYVDEELEERGLKDDLIGPIISITDTSTHIFAGPRPGGQWYQGRDNAWLKDDYAPVNTTQTLFYPLFSKKTFKGSWDVGIVMPNSSGMLTTDSTDYSTEAYRHNYESFALSYVTDANYTANSNQTTKFKFYPDGGFLCEDLITTGYGTTVPADTDGYDGQVFFKIIS